MNAGPKGTRPCQRARDSHSTSDGRERPARPPARRGVSARESPVWQRRFDQGEHRDQYRLPAVESIFQDLRYGLRALVRAPGFALVATLTLASALARIQPSSASCTGSCSGRCRILSRIGSPRSSRRIRRIGSPTPRPSGCRRSIISRGPSEHRHRLVLSRARHAADPGADSSVGGRAAWQPSRSGPSVSGEHASTATCR